MDIPKLTKGTSWAQRKLMKNSVIAVTVDDLNEGLIVVSFSHEDNLYQGVLLQLNRERGIPSGISFPKDYCTGSVVEPQGENDPTQIPPLPQRHTYFQDRDGTMTDPVGLKSRVGLRRVIKPPARFKNSRMSLRLRSRPVLCAKCRTLCEDKVSAQSTDPAECTEASKKIPTAGGVTTRRGKSALGVTCTTNISSADNEANQDYSFVSVGSSDLVENYWKRPSLMPLPDEKERVVRSTTVVSGQGGTAKSPGEAMEVVKSVPRMPRLNPSVMNENKLTFTLTKDSNNKILPKLLVSTSSGGFDKTVKIKKSKNIRMVVSKFPTDTEGLTDTEKHTQFSHDLNDVGTHTLKDRDIIPDPLVSDMSLIDPTDVSMKDDIGSNSKMWEHRIRKKSTVPARFRDEGYVTKNIFGFKRRRAEDEGPEEDSQEFGPRLCAYDEGDQDSIGQSTDVNKMSSTESSSSDMSRTTTPTSAPPNVPCLAGSSNGHSENKVTEPAKTPVIKISFGTPGNGVVVKIPPKAKQEDSSNLNDKAARRAMKKAKKEARRKLSLSRESSPSAQHALPPLPPTPSPPILNPEFPLVPSCDESDAIIGDRRPPDMKPLEPSYHFSKKKKKEKKKKRSKASKENGNSTSNQGTSIPSPNNDDSLENEERTSPVPSLTSGYPESITYVAPSFPGSTPPLQLLAEGPDVNQHSDSTTKLGNSTAEDESSTAEVPQRLCISLKRLNDSSNVSWDITQSCNNICSHHELDSNEPEQVGSPTGSEPNDYPMNDSPSNEQRNVNAASIDTYTDEFRNYVYKKGDIVWGKLPGCPWWPGKILDILFVDVDDVTARVSWYRASTLSCIRFSQLGPFAEQFETRYTRSRKRGSYQHAVRDALIEAHQLDPNDLPSD